MKTIKLFFHLIIICLFISCSDNVVLIYSHTSTLDGDELFGNEINKFFNTSEYIQKIKTENNKEVLLELNKIKENIRYSPSLTNLELNEAYYKYAFVFNNDTLYAHSSLTSWRYKNKIGTTNQNKAIEDIIFKYFEKK